MKSTTGAASEDDVEVRSSPSPRGTAQTRLAVTLVAAMAAAPLLTTGVSALGPLIRSDLGLSRTEFGLFAVVLFSTTALLSVPVGWLVDRVGHRTGLALNYLLAFSALALLAAADGPTGFALSAVIGGAAQAFSNPLTNSMAAGLAQPGGLGTMIATKQVGPQLAQVITAVAYPAAAALLASWRAGVGLGAALVLTSMVASLVWFLPRAVRRVQRPAAASPASPAQAVRVLSGTILAVYTAYAFLSGIVYQALIFTLPLFAHEGLGYSLQAAGMASAVVGTVGLASRFLWGAAADRLGDPAWALAGIAVVTAGSVSLLLAATILAAPWLLWLGSAFFGASGPAVVVVLTATVVRQWPSARAGVATSLMSLGNFAGFATGPYLFGTVSDHAGYSAGWTVLIAVQLVAALLPPAARAARRRTNTAQAPPFTPPHSPR